MKTMAHLRLKVQCDIVMVQSTFLLIDRPR